MSQSNFHEEKNRIKKSKPNYNFLRIDHELDHQIIYFGAIRKLNSKLALVELRNEGKHLLSLETIQALSIHTENEYHNLSIKDRLFPKSYFIIKRDFVSKLLVFSAIDLINRDKKKILIGIDGNASSGKTTFSKLLSHVYDCNIFHMDDYFQKPMIDPNDDLSFYASNINFKRLHQEIIDPIREKADSRIHTMNLKTHTLLDEQIISYKKISIIEGAYSMHPYIINNHDLKIFMKTTYIKQIFNIWKRNGLKKLIQFIRTWIPMENKYFSDLDIENKADIILKR